MVGLFRKNDVDGIFGLSWSNDFMEVCFHVSTLMPKRAHYQRFENKKQHIGNDNVLIVFSESGKQLMLNLNPCDVNLRLGYESERYSPEWTFGNTTFVQIIISPITQNPLMARCTVVTKPAFTIPPGSIGPLTPDSPQVTH